MTSTPATLRRVRRSFAEPIRSRLDTLRKVRLRDLATRFAFGFTVSVLAGLVTLTAGDRAGGLFLAFPAILPASLTLIDTREGRQEAEVDVSGAVLGGVALTVFAIVSWQLSDRASLGVTQGLAATAWVLTAAALYIAARRLVRGRARTVRTGSAVHALRRPRRC
jgi:uncharacterized membrane protein (GlpM family)